jgi:hypothetical protein
MGPEDYVVIPSEFRYCRCVGLNGRPACCHRTDPALTVSFARTNQSALDRTPYGQFFGAPHERDYTRRRVAEILILRTDAGKPVSVEKALVLA